MFKISKPLNLEKIRKLPNIATLINDHDLLAIGDLVYRGYEEDKDSRKDWYDQLTKALDLATLKTEVKNYPYQNSANIKYPLLTTANIQFASRTYPEIIRNGRVVECAIVGEDPNGQKAGIAKRISEHMSYQCLIESDSWEEGTDRLLNVLPTVGTAFKKVYFDPVMKQNQATFCLPDEIIVNDNISSLESAQRITHLVYKTKNDLIEQIRMERYINDEQLLLRIGMDELQKPVCLLEQHCWLDLDGDDYAEPYIVICDMDSHRVLRIVARFDGDGIMEVAGKVIAIKAVNYFTDYHFIPNPNGKYHSIGFGHLLTPLNSAVNTLLNQLVDSGTLSNLQGGFISSRIRSKEKDIRLKMGEFRVLNIPNDVNLQQNIMPLPYKEPSQVLFQLLGMLVQATKELSSVTDALTGAQDGQNVPATTMLALVEQGLKVFTSIQRRLYRGFKKEFEMLFRLNRIYLDPAVYYKTMGTAQAIFKQDYADSALSIRPVADPNISSDAQRMARTQVYMQLVAAKLVDPTEALKRYLNDLDIPNPEALLPKPAPPSPEMLELQLKAQTKAQENQLAQKDQQIKASLAEVDIDKAKAQVALTKAQAILCLAQAQAQKSETNINQDVALMEKLQTSIDALNEQTDRLNSQAVKTTSTQTTPGAATQTPASPETTPVPTESGVDNGTDNTGTVPGMAQSADNSGVLPSPTLDQT